MLDNEFGDPTEVKPGLTPEELEEQTERLLDQLDDEEGAEVKPLTGYAGEQIPLQKGSRMDEMPLNIDDGGDTGEPIISKNASRVDEHDDDAD